MASSRSLMKADEVTALDVLHEAASLGVRIPGDL
jgi:hypothetical protein